MRRLTTVIPTGLAIAALLGTATACDGDSADAGCASGSCHLTVHSGGSLSLGGQKFSVSTMDDTSVRLHSHGVSFTLHKGVSIGVGHHHLRLDEVEHGSAAISVDD